MMRLYCIVVSFTAVSHICGVVIINNKKISKKKWKKKQITGILIHSTDSLGTRPENTHKVYAAISIFSMLIFNSTIKRKWEQNRNRPNETDIFYVCVFLPSLSFSLFFWKYFVHAQIDALKLCTLSALLSVGSASVFSALHGWSLSLVISIFILHLKPSHTI